MMTLKYRKNKNLNRGNTQELKQRRMLIDFSLQFLPKKPHRMGAAFVN
jgi:hypothetical protein